MHKSIQEGKELGIQFDYERIERMARLFDVAEALSVERERLEEIDLPTEALDDLLVQGLLSSTA